MKGWRSFSNCQGVHNDVLIKVSCVSIGSVVGISVWGGGGGGGGGGGFPNCHGVHKDLVSKVSCVSIGSVVVIV